MIHARNDYNRIQDPSGKIAADEPVFLLRAQDKSAPETLRFWADENVRNGGDLEASQLAEQWADNMEKWQETHFSKPADLTPNVEVRGAGAKRRGPKSAAFGRPARLPS